MNILYFEKKKMYTKKSKQIFNSCTQTSPFFLIFRSKCVLTGFNDIRRTHKRVVSFLITNWTQTRIT